MIELLVVIAIIAILAGLLLPALAAAKESGRNAVCKSNLHQLSLGMLMYADESSEFLPWPGGVDRNSDPDWVFGGQPIGDMPNPKNWKARSFGFHAEAGSIFSYVMAQSRRRYDESFTNSFPVYQCPSTGPLGRAIRVNFSMNALLDHDEALANNKRTTSKGVRATSVNNPTQKLLVVQESPETMQNASFTPGTGANAVKGKFVMHNGKANFAFIDGHIESVRKPLIIDMLANRNNLERIYFDPYY